MDQRRMSRLIVVLVESENPAPISQAARLAMIRELLVGEGFPLVERVVSLLVLLYAQPVARVVRLRVEDVLQEPDGVFLRLGTPASPVPEPVDELVPRLLRERPSLFPRSDPYTPWLLPGQRAGQPMTRTTSADESTRPECRTSPLVRQRSGSWCFRRPPRSSLG
jgi:hypothetical protein